MRPLDQITLETAHLNYIQIDRYWLLENGKVGLDTVQEQVVKSSHFSPESVNNSLIAVKSQVIDLDQCPAQVKTAFTSTLARRVRRPTKQNEYIRSI